MISHDKGKGILGRAPLGFPSRDPLVSPPMIDLGHMCPPFHLRCLDGNPHSNTLQCPKFNRTNFRGLCSKLEQYFEADGVANNAKVRIAMLHLEGRALD